MNKWHTSSHASTQLYDSTLVGLYCREQSWLSFGQYSTRRWHGSQLSLDPVKVKSPATIIIYNEYLIMLILLYDVIFNSSVIIIIAIFFVVIFFLIPVNSFVLATEMHHSTKLLYCYHS